MNAVIQVFTELLFFDQSGERPDPMLDDQALFFDSSEGRVVLLGCAHAGVINTLRHIESVAGASEYASVIGGMHLLNASDERIRFTLDELRRRDLHELVPIHCTGWSATLCLWNAFPERCREGAVGATLHFWP